MGQRGSKKSTLGITPQEKKLIVESWNIAKRDLSRNGVVLFLIFFRDYPHNLKYFNFASTSLDSLEKNPLLKLHALRVMREMSSYVENIGKEEALLQSLRQNALHHRKRNIAKSAYDELRTSALNMMLVQLGPQKITPEVAAAWDKAIRILFQIITDINDEKKCVCNPLPRLEMNTAPIENNRLSFRHTDHDRFARRLDSIAGSSKSPASSGWKRPL